MSLKFYEELKSLFRDVEIFLSITLKDAKLSKAATIEKDDILKKLTTIQEEFPQLKVEISRTDSKKEVSTSEIKKPEVRVEKPVFKPAQTDDSEIYDDIGQEALSEIQDPYKPPSSISDGSEAVPDVSGSSSSDIISAREAMSNCSYSGFLIRGKPGKSKMNIKQIFSGLFGGKKYCVVAGGIFYIFDKGNSEKQSSSFALRGYEARTSADGKAKEGYLFELVSPGQKSYVFAADSQEEMNKWITAINDESLKMPDPRMSVICGDDISTGSDYEDPTPSLTSSSNVHKKPKSFTSDVEELYDDVENQKDHIESDSEVYEDTSNIHNEILEEIYEDCDNYASAPPVVLPPKMQPFAKMPTPVTTIVSPVYSTPPPSVLSMGANDYENMYYGRWDCRADDDNELAFKRGDIVLILSREFDRFGWWIGKMNGSVGLVPREYMTPAYELVS